MQSWWAQTMKHSSGSSTLKTKINMLIENIGVSEPLDLILLHGYLNHYENDKCIKAIANHFNLPIKIKITSVVSKTKYGKKVFDYKEDIFGENTEFALAKVIIPHNLPNYYSCQLKDYPIEVIVDSNLHLDNDLFISTIAHEISHIYLHSLDHPDKEDEIVTDIVAVLKGFGEFMLRSRVKIEKKEILEIVYTKKTHYGYLAGNQLYQAMQLYNDKLKNHKKSNNKAICVLNQYNSFINKFKMSIDNVNAIKNYFNLNHGFKTQKEDIIILMTLFSADFIPNLQNRLSQHLNIYSRQILYFCNINHYNEEYVKKKEEYDAEMKPSLKDIIWEYKTLKRVLNVSQKYIPLKMRLKFMFLFWIKPHLLKHINITRDKLRVYFYGAFSRLTEKIKSVIFE